MIIENKDAKHELLYSAYGFTVYGIIATYEWTYDASGRTEKCLTRIIFKDAENKPKGLTTASTIWCTASIGIAVGLNMFVIAIVATILLFFLLELAHYKWYKKWKNKII